MADGKLTGEHSEDGFFGISTENPNGDIANSGIRERITEWQIMIREMLPVGKLAVLKRDRKRQLMDLLQNTMEQRIQESYGDYLLGKTVTLADCCAFPFLWRLDQEFGLEEGLGCPKLGQWVKHCTTNSSIRKTITSSWWWWW